MVFIMKFICNKASLCEAVMNVSKAVSDRTNIPALEGIRFRLSDSVLELTGYDLEIGIRTSIPVRSEDSGEFVANAKLFLEMIRRMDGEDVLVSLSDTYQITISGGSTTFDLFATSANDFPELPQKDDEAAFMISQPVLKDMIIQTRFAVAKTDIKPILKGELFDIENGVLDLVAIDGYRLAVRYEPVKCSENLKFVVPSKTLNEIVSILGDNDEDAVSVFISKKHIIFEINGYMVYSRLLEGEFHPYKSAIPKSHNTEVIINRKDLIATLERAMLLINERTPSPVRCYFENNSLRIHCSTALGKVNDEIGADITGEKIEIGFKCQYLLDPLKVIKEDQIKLQMGGSLLPMKIIPCEGDSYTFLVLPVRLPKE